MVDSTVFLTTYMTISDNFGNVLDDTAPSGTKKALIHPFSANRITFTKYETNWRVDPGQLIAQAAGDKTAPLIFNNYLDKNFH